MCRNYKIISKLNLQKEFCFIFKMKVAEFARTVFQLIAFGFFVFQMQNSVGTYFEKPIVQLKSTGNLWQ